MSEGCGNPNCPTHGNSPQAIARRQALQEMKVNGEFMDVVRLMAANIHQSMEEKARSLFQAPNPIYKEMLGAILAGNHDSDPIVQGVLRGFTVMVTKGHEPTKTMLASCAEVQEPYAIPRFNEALKESQPSPQPSGPQTEFIPGLGLVLSFSSPEDLAAYLKGQR